MKKRSLCLLLSLALCLLFSATAMAGTKLPDIESLYDTTTEVYIIDSAEDLLLLADAMQDHKWGSAEKTFRQTQDIDLTALDSEGKPFVWIPIGTSENPFSGSFDGQGHMIYGLHAETGETAYLFGGVNGGSVQNVLLGCAADCKLAEAVAEDPGADAPPLNNCVSISGLPAARLSNMSYDSATQKLTLNRLYINEISEPDNSDVNDFVIRASDDLRLELVNASFITRTGADNAHPLVETQGRLMLLGAGQLNTNRPDPSKHLGNNAFAAKGGIILNLHNGSVPLDAGTVYTVGPGEGNSFCLTRSYPGYGYANNLRYCAGAKLMPAQTTFYKMTLYSSQMSIQTDWPVSVGVEE